MPPANVNLHSLDIIMDTYIPKDVKEWIGRQRSTNPWSNVYLLGLHQKMPQADVFMVITKTTLLPYSLNSWNHQKMKNTVSILFDILHYLHSWLRTYVCLLPKNLNFHKNKIWFIKRCVSRFGTMRLFEKRKHLRKSVNS